MSLPRVSVVIPNYNHARLLPRCLDAVLTQSVPADEVLVLDDASTDDSRQVLDGYARRFPRLRVLPNERNLGVVATMNRGLSLATGDYVGFFAADDEVLPGLFEHALPMLQRHPRAGMVFGHCEWRCQATGLHWTQGARMPDTPGYLAPADLVPLGKSGRLTLAGQHALFRKDALLAAGGWLPELRWFTDFFSVAVIAFRHGLCFVPRPMSVFYLYPTSYYNTAQSQAERRQVIRTFLQRLSTPANADILPALRASGILGGFGWPVLRVAASDPTFRPFLTPAFLRHAGRRTAEVVGRRFFPSWLARACLRWFYQRRAPGRTPHSP